MVACRFTDAGDSWLCDQCHRPLAKHANFKPYRTCSACLHMGAATGSTVKVACTTCRGNIQIEQPAYECAVRRRCLPLFQPNAKDLKKWNKRKPESDIYSLCPCQQFLPVVNTTVRESRE